MLIFQIAFFAYRCFADLAQQAALNSLAANIGGGCTAPNIINRAAQWYAGSNCKGTFQVELDSSGNVLTLFGRSLCDLFCGFVFGYANETGLTTLPTEIGLLTAATYM